MLPGFILTIYVALMPILFVATSKPNDPELLRRPPSILSEPRLPSVKSGDSRLRQMNRLFVRKPRKKDPAFLRKLLGNSFDQEWMSEEKPKDTGQSTRVQWGGWPYRDLQRQLATLNLTAELEDAGARSLLRDPSVVGHFERWLLKRASCPVRFAWEDIGSSFWPRWVKKGTCIDRKETCSWPPGKHCVPSGDITLNILKWHCRLAGSNRNRRRSFGRIRSRLNVDGSIELEQLKNDLKCQWIKVPYPITSECFCTC